MSLAGLQEAVLSEEMADIIAGRRVRTAVFTTFSFDPGFFELNILPMLFNQTFNQIEKVRRIQLEEALGTIREVAVYYDRRALAQDALPAQLNFSRIDISRGKNKGYFHPKLVLLLVDEPGEVELKGLQPNSGETLIVGALSANLTCAGWWENVETGHFEEIKDKDVNRDPCYFRRDLLDVIRHIKNMASPDENHEALDRIHQFLLQRVSRVESSRHSHAGKHHTRLFAGQQKLSTWLQNLRVGSDWNLEIVSPYFDAHQATVVVDLIEALSPRETRIFLPRDADGQALVTKPYFDDVDTLAHWSNLPETWTRRLGGVKADKLAPRRVHAKIYRLWHGTGKEIVIVGSVNLTSAAHSAASAGNLEAAYLVDVTHEGVAGRWWLRPLDEDPVRYAQKAPAEDDNLEPVCIDISLSYDWPSNTFSYRIDDEPSGPLVLRTGAGSEVCTIENYVSQRWVSLPLDAANQIRDLLRSTSFLEIVHPRGTWRVLIRETGMSHRPSIISDLTPEEILLYWSLLSPAQKEAFIIEKLAAAGEIGLEGIRVGRSERYLARDSIFDKFAGIYHAFERLRQQVTSCLESENSREAEARLFGAKYDSLPELLRKIHATSDDPILKYIVFLCGKQLANLIEKEFPSFWNNSHTYHGELSNWLREIPQLESQLPLDGEDRAEFISWYRKMFLNQIQQPVEVE